MKFTFNKVVTETINLSDDQVKQITIDYLKSLLAPGEYIRVKHGTAYLMQDDPEWRHGSVEEIVVREATELDKATWAMLQYLS